MMQTRTVLKRLLRYTLEDRPTVIKTVILLLLATAAGVAGPYLIKCFIDDHLVPGNWAVLPLVTLLLLYVLANITASWLGYQEILRLNQIAQSVVLKLRQRLFVHLLGMPLQRFDHVPVGSLISRVTNDTEAVKDLFVGVLGVYLKNAVRIIGIFIMMAFLNWHLMLICLLFLPLVIMLMMLYRKMSTGIFHRARELLAEINARLNETIQGVAVVQLFNQERRFAKRFNDLAQEHFVTRKRTMQMDALFLRPMVDVLYLSTLAGVLYYFGLNHNLVGIEVGVLYAFLNYLEQFTEPLIEMTQKMNLFQQSTIAAGRVFQWLEEKPDDDQTQPGLVLSSGALDFKQVSFYYDKAKPVLKNINFSIKAGAFVGIVGHSGSGKSTLVQLMMRFYQPQQGEILFSGHTLAQYCAREFSRHVAFVQQDSFLFSGSIYDNIDLGRNLPTETIRWAAETAGIDAHIQALSEGYNSLLTERGSNLSAGQQQLIGLARALAGKPQLLILDEATANVDSSTEEKIQHAMLKLRGQMTLVVIAHRLSTVTHADEILVLHQGEIIQRGQHQTLLALDGLYGNLYQLQFQSNVLLMDVALPAEKKMR
jgi:ATP-binding cassette subfamily B multidrug efflux pump